MYPTSKTFPCTLRCYLICNTDKVQNQGGWQYSFSSMFNSSLLVKNNANQLFNEHWYLCVKNTEVGLHDGTLNVITAIKLSDTDNLVVVGTFNLIKCELGPRESSQWRPIKESLHQFPICTNI